MNSLIRNPTLAQDLARQIIAERVRDAEQRQAVRAIREQRRATARASREATVAARTPRPRLRFLRLAH